MDYKVGDKVMFEDWIPEQKKIGVIVKKEVGDVSFYYRVEFEQGDFIHLLPQEMTLLSPVLIAIYEEGEQ